MLSVERFVSLLSLKIELNLYQKEVILQILIVPSLFVSLHSIGGLCVQCSRKLH